MSKKIKIQEQIDKLQKELKKLRQKEKEQRILLDGDPEINSKWFKTEDEAEDGEEGTFYYFCEKQKNGRYKAIQFCIMNEIRGEYNNDYQFLYEEDGVDKRIPNDGKTLYYSLYQMSIDKAELMDSEYRNYKQVSNLDLVLQGFNPDTIVEMAKNKKNQDKLFLFQNKTFIPIVGLVEMWSE